MTENHVIATINANTLAYLPSVIAGIQAAEAAGPTVSGPAKFQAVMAGIGAGSQTLESSPNPNMAGIAALINLSVFIFNMLGVFQHKNAAPTTSGVSPSQ